MVRTLLIAAAFLMLGASKPLGVGYRLSVTPTAGGPPVLDVEIRLRGDADGETRLIPPQTATWDPVVSGAEVSTPDAGGRVLRHRPGAKLVVRYRQRATGPRADQLALTGAVLFAAPDGRLAEPATFRWGRLPKGWRTVSSLDTGVSGQASVVDVVAMRLLAGPTLQVAERALPSGPLRTAVFGDAADALRLADAAAPVLTAQRQFWNDASGPFLVAVGFEAASGRHNGLDLTAGAQARASLSDDLHRAMVRAWIPRRIGQVSGQPGAAAIVEGLAGFYDDRIRLRAGLLPVGAVVATLAKADTRRDAASRGLILALKWDEDIRRKSGGKLDLDDVTLRMADHYRRFPAGQGPDVVTGLVSAAWVTAGLDLRPDIARYAEGGAMVPLPETLFGGCVDARVTVSPGFDSGFDHAGSFASKSVRGVRRGGPAWNSGLRNGMALEGWTFTAGDMSREIELNIRPNAKRAMPRKIRFWPYGDVDLETRRLQMAVGLIEPALAACARKIGGL